ncbi:MAG: restriction endonuclease subunit S [Janthinobacterium lividum]
MNQDAIANTEPRLGDLILTKPGKTGAAKPTEVVSFLGMEDVSEDGEILASHLLPLSSVKKGLTYFEKDDVLVAKITPCFENGKGANLELLKTNKGYGSTEFHVLRAKRDASAKYIFYHTQSVAFRKTLEGEMIGTAGQKRVPLAAIMKYLLPAAHSYAEQQAIAAALGEMDALLAAQRARLARLAKQRAVKQGLLQGLLSGKQRLPGFAGDWEVTTVNSLSTVSKGTQLHNSKMGSNGGFAHLNGGINPSGFTAEANTKGNTIAISEGGNSCGYVQFMALPFWCGGHCYTVTPKRSVDNDFLYHALKGEQENIMALHVGSGLPNVQKTALLNLKLKIPITLAEQRAIADVLSEADAYLAALEAEHAKTQLLKQGMMQNLLTGKLRLV